MDYGEESLKRRRKQNIIKIVPTQKIRSKDDLSIFYTPGVAAVSKKIDKDKSQVFKLTVKDNSIAVVSDGSAVLGLGNIGPEAALPVMEGKSLLFSQFAGLDAFPICLNTQDSKKIIETVKTIAVSFGGINLEDISAPRCFAIEKKLQNIGIPVMHDDQHGTAVVVLAGLINALKVVNKNIENCKIVISGAGAAGTAITKILIDYTKNRTPGVRYRGQSASKIVVLDRGGTIYIGRKNLSPEKNYLANITGNKTEGLLEKVIADADIFIGVSAPNILKPEMIKSMAKDAIVFAMANPVPEIDPVEAKKAGATVIATGRSDYENQINNVLAFPGIFRGALDIKALRITDNMKIAVAKALAGMIKKPQADKIVPSVLDKNVVKIVSRAVAKSAISDKIIRK